MSGYRIERIPYRNILDRIFLCRYEISDRCGYPLWYAATRRGARRWIRRH